MSLPSSAFNRTPQIGERFFVEQLGLAYNMIETVKVKEITDTGTVKTEICNTDEHPYVWRYLPSDIVIKLGGTGYDINFVINVSTQTLPGNVSSATAATKANWLTWISKCLAYRNILGASFNTTNAPHLPARGYGQSGNVELLVTDQFGAHFVDVVDRDLGCTDVLCDGTGLPCLDGSPSYAV